MSFIQKGIKAAELLISVHLLMKGVNFGLGILIARIMNPEIYGTGQIQLSLTTSAILHLSRESFRKVAVKTQSSPFGIMWVSVLLTSFIAFLTYLVNPDTTTLIISLAAIVEVFSEPFHISNLISIDVKPTAVAESVSTIINCLTVLLLSHFGAVAFSAGQLASSLSNFLVHYWHSREVKFNLQVSEVDKELLKTYVTIGFFKFFLSEGEKIFLTYMAYNAVDRGVFALVSNLCGIVPRLFYAPIEQVTYIVFTKTLSKEELRSGFTNILTIMWIIGLFFGTYMQIYSDLIIETLYGEKWEGTQASRALSYYSLYITIMGVFGATDAMDWGLSTKEQINRKKFSSTCCFIVFMTSAFLLAHYGASGLIFACILSMLTRLYFATKSSLRHFAWMHPTDMLPDIKTFSSFVFVYLLLRLIEGYASKLELVTIGCITASIHLFIMLKMHKEKILSIKSNKE